MTTIHTLRRGLAAAAVFGLAAAALAGCSTASGDDNADTTISFGYPAIPNSNTWETLAAQYEQETGKKVEVEAIPIDGYNPALSTRLQGGNAPDIFFTEPGTNGVGTGVTTLGAAGLLGEITGQAADLINPDELSAYQVDGKSYGFPLWTVPKTAVVIDSNLATIGGKFPETIDEMLTMCKTAKENGLAFTLGQFGSTFTADGQTLLVAASSVYAKDPDWDQKRADGEVTFAGTDGWRYALQTVSDMYTNGCYQDGAEAAAGEYLGDVMAGKTPAIVSMSTGEADIWKVLADALPDQTFSVQAFPGQTADTRRVINSVKYTVSYSAASPRKDAIQDYLDWLTQPAQLDEIADLTGGVRAGDVGSEALPSVYSPLASFIDDDEVISEPGLGTWPDGVLQSLQEGVPGLFTGQKTVDQILADMDAAYDK
ncbi:ABC transporter substrate-binding protein [Microbacterium sp. NPDC091313]